MGLSDWDRDNIDKIMWGEGDWFTAQLLRLVRKADSANKEKIRKGFPEEVALVEKWENSFER